MPGFCFDCSLKSQIVEKTKEAPTDELRPTDKTSAGAKSFWSQLVHDSLFKVESLQKMQRFFPTD
jgi:hypothetical protein